MSERTPRDRAYRELILAFATPLLLGLIMAGFLVVILTLYGRG